MSLALPRPTLNSCTLARISPDLSYINLVQKRNPGIDISSMGIRKDVLHMILLNFLDNCCWRFHGRCYWHAQRPGFRQVSNITLVRKAKPKNEEFRSKALERTGCFSWIIPHSECCRRFHGRWYWIAQRPGFRLNTLISSVKRNALPADGDNAH